MFHHEPCLDTFSLWSQHQTSFDDLFVHDLGTWISVETHEIVVVEGLSRFPHTLSVANHQTLRLKPLTLDIQLLRSLAPCQSRPHLHRDIPSHVFVLIGHLDCQKYFVSCSNVRVLTCPTNPWVDWEREWSLNFHGSVFVSVFLRHSELVFSLQTQSFHRCAWSGSAQVHSVGGMTKLALFHDQTQDSFRSHHVLFVLELSPAHGKIYALSQVDFVHVLHIGPSVCLHVPTRTLCILASESISLSDFQVMCERASSRGVVSTWNGSSVTREIYGRERCVGTDEEIYLSHSIMINAKSTILKGVSESASEIVFQPLHPDTSALSHSRGAQYVLSLMEHGHPETFLLMWSRR